nr:hypothetical protein [Moraxella sp. CTOTU48717]
MTEETMSMHQVDKTTKLFDPTRVNIIKASDYSSKTIELITGQIWNVGDDDDFQPVRIVGFGLSFGETWVEYDWYEEGNRHTDTCNVKNWLDDYCQLVAQSCDLEAWEKGEFKPSDDIKPDTSKILSFGTAFSKTKSLFGARINADSNDDAKPNRKHNHYFKDVSFLNEMDIYALCKAFGVKDSSGAKHHAIKKILCSGARGAKDEMQDIQEAIDTLTRLVELEREFKG